MFGICDANSLNGHFHERFDLNSDSSVVLSQLLIIDCVTNLEMTNKTILIDTIYILITMWYENKYTRINNEQKASLHDINFWNIKK